ncbi:MAG: hypothetical protein HFF84_02960 [Oscillibacter sp.]|nr:hypothetical protein [Oscillibacter sp.]
MPALEPLEELKENPLRFLESDQFREMLQTYRRLQPLDGKKPAAFKRQLVQYDFQNIYPLMAEYFKTHNLENGIPDDPETAAFAAALAQTFEERAAALTTQYDILGNSPATYFICGVWANMKRGREFHPASNGITVTYSEPDAYGNQNIRYRNKDYQMTLIFEAVQEYTKNLSWTAHRLLIYTLMRGNTQNWRNNAAVFNITEYMEWAGLNSRDAAYRQLKKDVQSITGVKLTAESFKKYFESFYTTHLATEASIKKYTGEIRITFTENVRHFLTQYYQLIPDWMGQLTENAYRMAFYLYYRARKAPVDEAGTFRVRVEDVIQYIGLPTKEEVKNRNYDEAILRPFKKAAEEIRRISGGSLDIELDYNNINTFLAGQITIRIDDAMQEYRKKLEKTKSAKQLEGKKRTRKPKAVAKTKGEPPEAGEAPHETTSEPAAAPHESTSEFPKKPHETTSE